jgi:hypothetical protein
MSDAICTKYGCDYQLDLDGQVTCSNCGGMGDDMPNPQPDLDNVGFTDNEYLTQDDYKDNKSRITPFLGPNR